MCDVLTCCRVSALLFVRFPLLSLLILGGNAVGASKCLMFDDVTFRGLAHAAANTVLQRVTRTVLKPFVWIKSSCEKVQKDYALRNSPSFILGFHQCRKALQGPGTDKSLLQVLVLARFFPPLWASHAEDRVGIGSDSRKIWRKMKHEGWNRDKHGPWLWRLWLLKIKGIRNTWQTFRVLFQNRTPSFEWHCCDSKAFAEDFAFCQMCCAG